MSDEKYRNYLADLGAITKEYAREAIVEHVSAKGSDEESYKTGYMMGFHRFVTLMQQQADSFGIRMNCSMLTVQRSALLLFSRNKVYRQIPKSFSVRVVLYIRMNSPFISPQLSPDFY